MKVVLFCGGLGMRIRDHSETIPKPMVTIGYRPILWHLMRYYSHFGHKDFILCLGYKGDAIKNYFLNYDECLSNDFVLTEGCKNVQLLNTDLRDWRITFVDTGLYSNIGQRLKAIKEHLNNEEVFLANYSDGLTDLHLPTLIEHFYKYNKVASVLSINPPLSFHLISTDGNDEITRAAHINETDLWINGGYFVFKKEIFDYINEGEDLLQEPFQRLIAKKQVTAYKYDGFWACMDTFKEKQNLEEIYSRGEAPWEVWKPSSKEKNTYFSHRKKRKDWSTQSTQSN